MTPLRDRGFEIFTNDELPEVDASPTELGPPRNPDMFIVLWNPEEWFWSHETRAMNEREVRQTGVFIGEWSLGGRRGGGREGDRFFMLMVGALPRGVIAAGRALGPAFRMHHWDAAQANKWIWYADIAWEALLDEETLLTKETL